MIKISQLIFIAAWVPLRVQKCPTLSFAAEAEMKADSWALARIYNRITFNFL